MPYPLSLDVATPITTLNMVALYQATWPRLVALREIARRLAPRRTDGLVPADIADDARRLLADAGSIVVRQRGARRELELHGPLDWATLLGKLELALVGFDIFRTTYSGYDPTYSAVVWHDELWHALAQHPDTPASPEA